jgi:hypothetical protein
MSPERWRQIEELYHAAREHGPALLADIDPELRREVETLLGQDLEGNILERPAVHLLKASTVNQHQAADPSGGPGTFMAETAAANTESTAPLGGEDGETPGNESAATSKYPPWWMYIIAAAFLTHVVLSGSVCLWGPEPVGLRVAPGDEHPLVAAVAQGSPADRARIRPGDRLLSAAGKPLFTVGDWFVFLFNVEVGLPYRVELTGDGHPRVSTLSLRRQPASYWFTAQGIIRFGGFLVSLCCLAIACLVAFMRSGHRLARVGALMLAIGSGVMVTPVEGLDSMWRQWPPVAQVLLCLATFLTTVGIGVFFTFFALFPRPSFRRRWLWAVAWIPVLVLSASSRLLHL